MSTEPLDVGAFKDKIDMKTLYLLHMNRTNQASGNETGIYNSYVRQQLRLLPLELQNWVESQNEVYETENKILVFKTSPMGRDLGYKNNPLVWNEKHTKIGLSSKKGFTVKRLPGEVDWNDPNIAGSVNTSEDPEYVIEEYVLFDKTKPVKRLIGEIDWTDPNIYSPYVKYEPYIDYEKFNKLILIASERTGLSWKPESTNSEYGLYPKIETDLGTKTPLDNPKKNEPPEQNPLHQICWINYKGTAKRVTNFRGYAVGIGAGEKPWFFNDLAIRQAKQQPIVCLATAEQGAGKTYCVIRLAEILDPKFDPQKQIVMNRTEILKLVSGRGGLKRNQVIIIDEAQFGASSREWGKKEQIQLMKHLAAARFKGFVIFIVALHRSMLDNIIRDRLLTYHIHMEERGLGIVYKPKHQRFDEKQYPPRKGKLLLQLPDYDACDYVSCLGCDKNETCNTIRSIYERKKTAFVESEADKDEKAEFKLAAQEMGEKELAELCEEHVSDINLTAKGYYSIEDIRYVLLDKYGLDVSTRKGTRVRAYLMKLTPPDKTLLA